MISQRGQLAEFNEAVMWAVTEATTTLNKKAVSFEEIKLAASFTRYHHRPQLELRERLHVLCVQDRLVLDKEGCYSLKERTKWAIQLQ